MKPIQATFHTQENKYKNTIDFQSPTTSKNTETQLNTCGPVLSGSNPTILNYYLQSINQ